MLVPLWGWLVHLGSLSVWGCRTSQGSWELGCFSVTVHLRASDQSRALPGSPASFGLSSDHPATSLGIQAGCWIPILVKSGLARRVDLHSSGVQGEVRPTATLPHDIGSGDALDVTLRLR